MTAGTADVQRRILRADDPALGPWQSFLRAHARLTRRLDEDLREQHGMSLAEYDALFQLSQAPGRRLRMSRLADQVLLSRSGVTRLIDRLVEDGAVERVACSDDARGAEAVLTRVGLDRLRAAARTHLEGIQRWFVEQVEPRDLQAMDRAFGRVVEALDSGSLCEDETTEAGAAGTSDG